MSKHDEALMAARSLLCAALIYPDDPVTLDALVAVPEPAWPDLNSGALAHSIRSLIMDKHPITVESVVHETLRLELLPEFWDVMRAINEDVFNDPVTGGQRSGTCDPWRESTYLTERAAKYATLAAAQSGDPDAVRQALGQFDHAPRRLRLDNIPGAPPAPPAVFTNGPRRGTLSLLVAESGIGKSWLSLAMAASVALGEPVGFKSLAPTSSAPALILSYEDSPSIIRDRYDRIIGVHRLPHLWAAMTDGRLSCCTGSSLPGPLLAQERPGTPVRPTALWQSLDATLAELKPALLVLDPMSAVLGVSSENDNQAIGQAAEHLTRLAERHNVAVLLVHHSSKAGAAQPSQHSTRGASALACRSRWMAQITEDEHQNLKLHVTKSSYSPIPRPIYMRRDEQGPLVEIAPDQGLPGTILAALREVSGDVTIHGVRKNNCDSARELINAVEARHPGISHGAVAKEIESMVQAGRLKVVAEARVKGGTAEYIRIPEALQNASTEYDWEPEPGIDAYEEEEEDELLF